MQRESQPIRSFFSHRRGLTLVEMLVSIVILAVVAGLVLVGINALRASQARSITRQQIAAIASAIDRYADFWPQWKVVDTSSVIPVAVTLSDRGWPDHIAGRLFDDNAYQSIATFNDDFLFFANNGIFTMQNGEDEIRVGDVLSANICLAYALTSSSGKGPFITIDDDSLYLKEITEVTSVADPLLPAPLGGLSANRAQRALVLVDAWGTPYRYFWVFRDAETNLSQRAYKGYLPVDYGAFLPGSGAGGVQNSAMFQDDADPDTFKKAVGYVLESAGPDKRFGNVWRVNPSAQEIEAAADNIIRLP